MPSQSAKSSAAANSAAEKSARSRKPLTARESSKPAAKRRHTRDTLASAKERFDTFGVSRNQAVGALAATAVGIGVGLFITWLRQRDADQPSQVAFAHDEMLDRDNFDQTRSAGPAAMRDGDQDWDPVDQASDESFPASDPPSTY